MVKWCWWEIVDRCCFVVLLCRGGQLANEGGGGGGGGGNSIVMVVMMVVVVVVFPSEPTDRREATAQIGASHRFFTLPKMAQEKAIPVLYKPLQ